MDWKHLTHEHEFWNPDRWIPASIRGSLLVKVEKALLGPSSHYKVHKCADPKGQALYEGGPQLTKANLWLEKQVLCLNMVLSPFFSFYIRKYSDLRWERKRKKASTRSLMYKMRKDQKQFLAQISWSIILVKCEQADAWGFNLSALLQENLPVQNATDIFTLEVKNHPSVQQCSSWILTLSN